MISLHNVKHNYGPTLKNQFEVLEFTCESETKGKINPVLIVIIINMYLKTNKFSRLRLISFSKAATWIKIMVASTLTPDIVIGIENYINFYFVKFINQVLQSLWDYFYKNSSESY